MIKSEQINKPVHESVTWQMDTIMLHRMLTRTKAIKDLSGK